MTSQRHSELNPLLEEQTRIEGMRIGWLSSVGADGSLHVDFQGNPHGPLVARTTVSLQLEEWHQAAFRHQQVVLFFDGGVPTQPILIGLLQPTPPTPLIDAVLEQTLPEKPKEIRLDDRRLILEGRDEVVLRCGKSTLILRSDGKVILRGVNVVTEAEEVHRIRGGKVKIN